MASFDEMHTHMLSTPNQAAVDHVQTFMANRRKAQRGPNLLESLANLAYGPPFTLSVLERVLRILRAQYDEERDSQWALKLRPWECRLLDNTIGSVFTKVFCTKLCIPFDGCYENIGDIGRAEGFLINFGDHAVRVANRQPMQGALDPAHIKELVFYQDPLFSSTDSGMPRDLLQCKSAWHFVRRYMEDLKEGKLLTVTPKRAKLYEKLCLEGHEAEMESLFNYDHNKVSLMWIRIIDLLRFLPNLEVFRFQSDAPVVEAFVSAISYFCRNLNVLEFNLSRPFDKDEYALQAWNRFYQDEPGGQLYQSKGILEKPVAKYLCEYLLQEEAQRETNEFPDQCRISFRLNLRNDMEVTMACDTIGAYCGHLQSLIVDRSKSYKPSVLDSILEQALGQPLSHLRFGVSQLSLISTGVTVNNYIMRSIELDSIESLELINCETVQTIYMPIIRNGNRLRKFKIVFSPPDDAKERAYSYWKHYVLQKRLTFDFLRCDLIELDELDIRGDFGEPTLHPAEFSGLTTDLFFAIEMQAKSLVRLQVVNNDIDFSLAEIGSILCKAPKLTQLALTCRAFAYQDNEGNWIEEGLGIKDNFERFLRFFASKEAAVSLTILRTHYNPLDEPVFSRDAADRHIIPRGTALDFEATAKSLVEQSLPIAHFAVFSEGPTNAYGIFGVKWDEYLGRWALVDLVLQEDVHGALRTHEEFEKVNTEWIQRLGVVQPRPVNGPPPHI